MARDHEIGDANQDEIGQKRRSTTTRTARCKATRAEEESNRCGQSKDDFTGKSTRRLNAMTYCRDDQINDQSNQENRLNTKQRDCRLARKFKERREGKCLFARVLVVVHGPTIAITILIVTIEFSNNGVIDSLTHAPAPAIFLQNLRREFAGAQREKRALSIISIQSSPHEIITEPQLTALARTIVTHLRSDEFFSRISETGYWIAVRGGVASAGKLANRIVGEENKRWRTSVIECTPSLTFDEWIELVDRTHFDEITSSKRSS